jgi:dihydropyrimidine dehydrogenase (NADP+)
LASRRVQDCFEDKHVQVVTGKKLHKDDLTLEKLRSNGVKAVFIGIGMPEPKVIDIFKGFNQSNGFYTSKDFLPMVAKASKPGYPS